MVRRIMESVGIKGVVVNTVREFENLPLAVREQAAIEGSSEEIKAVNFNCSVHV
jgi:hypothetical protein